ncbi:insulinase family protein, partial [candidate division KSB1 bacterium]|nr:insulinase family protein [candidate division KSB1 bacterium]
MKKSWSRLFLPLLLLAATAPAQTKLTVPFERFILPNGLNVILHEDHTTPTVTVNLWYHVGSGNEKMGRTGFAHLFEHILFEGSGHVPEGAFDQWLEAAGGNNNGSTNGDRTNYYEDLPKNALELALFLESDRMGYLLEAMSPEKVDGQRDVVKNERRQNYENAPYGLVSQLVRAALFPAGHPYHLLTIGTPEDLDAASLDDVKGFFRTFYVPNNATLVIAGDIDVARTKALVEKYFGPIARGAPPPVKTAPEPSSISVEKRLDVEADVELPRVQMTWATPPIFAPGDAELDLVAQVLATGKTSRLYKRLVYDLQIAQDVWAGQQSSQLASMFEIMVTLRKGKSPEQALKIVDEELDKLRKAPPSADEIERARARTVSGLVFQMERVTGRANALNSYNQLAGDPGYFPKDVARYERATEADLRRAAADLLPAGRRVVTVVKPTPGAPKAGR